MKIKDFISLFLALLGFGMVNGSANWSFLWAILGIMIFLSAVTLFCYGREPND